MSNEHFSDEDIDAIKGDEKDNYFIPVYEEIFRKIKKPQLVCDVGCGNGLYSSILSSRFNCKMTGIDGNEYALGQAKNRGISDIHKIDDFCTDVLPLESNKYDLVVCKDVFEHLLKPEFLVKEIFRITKNEGYVLIHVPNHFPISGRLKLLFNNDIDPFSFFPNAKRWNFPHIRFFTRDSLIELMKDSNLNLDADLSHHFIVWSKLFKYLPKNVLNKNTDLFSHGITILFKKSI